MVRPLRIVFLALLSFLLLEACGKNSGFHIQQMVPLVAIPKTAEEKAQQRSASVPKPGSVVRHSGKIQVSQMGNPVESSGLMTVKADVTVDGQSFGQIEFRGTKKDSKIILEPIDPAYNEKLKATAYCLSDDCNQYFIDVFYKENDVYYQDQFQTASVEETADAPTEVQEPKSGVAKDKKDPKAEAKKEPKPDVKNEAKKDDKNDMKPETKKEIQKQPIKSIPPAEVKKIPAVLDEPALPAVEKDFIQDYIPVADAAELQGFVGTSDDEAKALFEKTKAEPAQAITPAVPPKAAPPSDKPPVKAQPAQSPHNKSPLPDVPKAVVPKAPTPQKEKEKVPPEAIVPEMNKDFPWTIRKDQAIGTSGNGKLRNPTDFLQLSKLPKVFFFIAQSSQSEFFGVLDLAQVLQKVGEYLQTLFPGKRLAILDVSKKFGGHLSPHEGHQNGTEADVRYLVRGDESLPSDVVVGGKVTNQLLAADQWKLFKKFFELKQVEVIFVDQAVKRAMCDEAKRSQDLKSFSDQEGPTAEILKRLYPVNGHDTHFHVKVKCDHELCRRQPYLKKPQTGC